MKATRDFLQSLGLPPGDLFDLPTSDKRFPDGAQYRVEIPSVEGPRALAAVLEEAASRQVLVHRISQGSGVMLLTDGEIKDSKRFNMIEMPFTMVVPGHTLSELFFYVDFEFFYGTT